MSHHPERKVLMRLKQYLSLLICFILLFCSISHAECIGSNYSEAYPGELFQFCWEKNHPNDMVVGYRSYKSTTSGNYVFGQENAFAEYDDVDISSHHSLSNIGTHYFVLTAFDNYGHESDKSNEVTITITEPQETSPKNLTIIAFNKTSENVLYKNTIDSTYIDQKDIIEYNEIEK